MEYINIGFFNFEKKLNVLLKIYDNFNSKKNQF